MGHIFNQEKTNRMLEEVDLELMEVYSNFTFVFTLSSTTPEFDFTLHWPQVHYRLVCTVAGISVLGVLIFLPSSLKEEAVQGVWMVLGGCDQVQQGGSVTAWVSPGCAYIHTQTHSDRQTYTHTHTHLHTHMHDAYRTKVHLHPPTPHTMQCNVYTHAHSHTSQQCSATHRCRHALDISLSTPLSLSLVTFPGVIANFLPWEPSSVQ